MRFFLNFNLILELYFSVIEFKLKPNLIVFLWLIIELKVRELKYKTRVTLRVRLNLFVKYIFVPHVFFAIR